MRFLTLALPIPILMMIIAFFNFYQYNQESVYICEERMMDIQVNYCTDAAVQQMIKETMDLGATYRNQNAVTVDPQIAYDTYVMMLCRNFGWSDTEQNRTEIASDSIPFFCVAGYDGYYMFERCKDKEVIDAGDGTSYVQDAPGFVLKSTPKLPYTYEKNGTMYALNLSWTTCTSVKSNPVYSNSIKAQDVIDTNTPYPLSKADAQWIITQKLSEEMTYALQRGTEAKATTTIFIPNAQAKLDVPSIEGPSVFTYLVSPSGASMFEHNLYGYAGTRIDENRRCVCYQVNGQKLYTYQENATNDKVIKNGVSYSIEYICDDRFEAAKRGYYFDIDFVY